MDDIYEQILVRLEHAVNLLAGRVADPRLIDFGSYYAFRHVEKSIHQAIVQKLARMVSTLDAARLLLDHGFVQEQASLQRVLDEIQEDIAYSCVRDSSRRNRLVCCIANIWIASLRKSSTRKRQSNPPKSGPWCPDGKYGHTWLVTGSLHLIRAVVLNCFEP